MTSASCAVGPRLKSTKSPITEEALKRIGALYQIEAEITGQSAATRLATRQSRAVAILDVLRDWLTVQRRRLSAKNALAKAIQYRAQPLGGTEPLCR